MRKVALLLALTVVLSCFAAVHSVQAEFPKKPITFMIYTKPGGLADITARKIIAVAAKYTDTTFVALNKPGAGGIVAMKAIQQGKTDGHTILMATMSNIAKVVTSKGDVNLDDFTWLAMMVSDAECIITNKTQDVNTWEQLVADAEAKGGKQIWVGPAAGGRDHVMAMKVWESTGLAAKWIPYASGGKAMAALLGKHGVAYVGNPLDTIGKEDLKVAAISRTERLEQFPDVPTFKELGVEGLDNEIMWRGVIVKKGTDPEALEFYADLFQKVTDDPEWKAFLAKGGADAVYYGPDKFAEIKKKDAEEFTTYLKKIGVLE